MDELYVKYVENILNNSGDVEEFLAPSDEVDDYKQTTALRLIKIWKKYKDDEQYLFDFEISLRNFLLVFKTCNLHIEKYRPSKFAKDNLGLFNINNDICVQPSSIDDLGIKTEFLRRAEMDCVLPAKNEVGVNLKTNSFIKGLTGYKMYKSSEQKACVLGALNAPNGYSVLISMSTGGGKSLVSQAVSYQKDGLSIIVVPTISLMLDQVKNARLGIKPKNPDEIYFYNSATECDELIEKLDSGIIRMLYISPESLIRNNAIRDKIVEINKKGLLNNLIIDEAHVIIEWGSFFRVDFQCLDVLQRQLLHDNHSLRTYLLSATFTCETIEVLKNEFSKDNKWIEIHCDSLRKEPTYSFVPIHGGNAKEKLAISYIMKLPHPMIVYVMSPDEANYLYSKLKSLGINNIGKFTGLTEDEERSELIEDWKNDNFEIMVATCAFGVGVDKKNIRTVLHLYVPDNINKYYQEAGRGGRDGLPCLSVVLYDQENDFRKGSGLKKRTISSDLLVKRWCHLLHTSSSGLWNKRIMFDMSSVPAHVVSGRESESNEQWNMHVLLLLKKYNLIDIVNVIQVNGRFFCDVLINDSSLLCVCNGEPLQELKNKLNKIRELEDKLIDNDFKEMYKLLNNNRHCISFSFVNIFEYADRYCAGCAVHSRVINNASKSNPLKRVIEFPIENNNCCQYLYYCLETISDDRISWFFNAFDTFVSDEPTEEDNYPFANRFSVNEYVDYIDKAPYILLNNIFIHISEPSNIELLIRKTRILYGKYKPTIVLQFNQDFFVKESNKLVSELLAVGSVKRLYSFNLIKEFKND